MLLQNGGNLANCKEFYSLPSITTAQTSGIIGDDDVARIQIIFICLKAHNLVSLQQY